MYDFNLDFKIQSSRIPWGWLNWFVVDEHVAERLYVNLVLNIKKQPLPLKCISSYT